MSSSTKYKKRYQIDPSWINSLYGTGNVYGSGNVYGNTTYGSTTWQNTVSATNYTAYTNPQDPHTQFIEALISHVKVLIQDMNHAEEQKRIQIAQRQYPYTYYSSGTTADPQIINQPSTSTSYPFSEDSSELRQFRNNIRTLIEWYVNSVKTELEYEHFKELEELLELPTPKTQKD